MQQHQEPIAIADLYPDFTNEELEEAQANLRRYLSVLARMSDRLADGGRSINDLVDGSIVDGSI